MTLYGTSAGPNFKNPLISTRIIIVANATEYFLLLVAAVRATTTIEVKNYILLWIIKCYFSSICATYLGLNNKAALRDGS